MISPRCVTSVESALPTFLIVGAAKSGTSSLYHYLARHPDVFMAAVKEPCFFSSYGLPASVVHDNVFPADDSRLVTEPEHYRRLFEPAMESSAAARGEASTHYLFQYETTIDNLRRFYGESARSLKVLILLRNPVEAAFSNYRMWRNLGREAPTFEAALRDGERRRQQGHLNIDYVRKFSYAAQVAAYQDAFPHVAVHLYDDLVHRPHAMFAEVCNFLGVDAAAPKNVGQAYHRGADVHWPALKRLFEHDPAWKRLIRPMVWGWLPGVLRDSVRRGIARTNARTMRLAPRTRAALVEAFRDDVEATARRIGRGLSHWLRRDAPVPSGE